jgi:3'-5' exoribonuclease
MKYPKKQTIDSLKDGVRVEDIFAVKLKKGFAAYAKGYSFHLILTDSSGKSIDYKYWGGPNEKLIRGLYDAIPTDGVVLLSGRVSSYMDKLQISTNEPDSILPLAQSEYDTEEFIPKPRRDIDEMHRELKSRIESVQNPDVRRLLERIFQDPELIGRFKKHPGAIEIHHNWTGGLMQHTLEVAEFCIVSKRMFPALNLDIMIAGALLHDIGKLQEIEVSARIKGSKQGQLHGHIAQGFVTVSGAMDELKTPKDTRDRILHILLSHHGSLEYGSPKPPMTPEAFAVYYADEMSSKLSEIVDYVEWARDSTDDEFMYHKRHGHNILLK